MWAKTVKVGLFTASRKAKKTFFADFLTNFY